MASDRWDSSRRKAHLRESYQIPDQADQPIRPSEQSWRMENVSERVEAYSCDVWMIDPRLQNEWSYAVYNHDRIIILGSHREHEVVSSCPGRQVFPAKTSQFTILLQVTVNNLPVALVTMNGNVLFSAICLDENQSSRLLSCKISGAC